ncbi:MAG: hypothetical protein MJZ15_09050 [Bacteroidales bacterium]|nr:hypothetical protein [Bacteroidales bacterium]
MAKLELRNSKDLAKARRMVRRGGCFTLTVRHGRVYTYKLSEQRQPNSVKQVEQRKIFEKANAIVSKELKKKERLEYWRKVAKESGKKTARGAAIAYWCKRLKSEAEEETHFNSDVIKWRTERCHERRELVRNNFSRNIWIGCKNRLILHSLSKGEVASVVKSRSGREIERTECQTG